MIAIPSITATKVQTCTPKVPTVSALAVMCLMAVALSSGCSHTSTSVPTSTSTPTVYPEDDWEYRGVGPSRYKHRHLKHMYVAPDELPQEKPNTNPDQSSTPDTSKSQDPSLLGNPGIDRDLQKLDNAVKNRDRGITNVINGNKKKKK